MKNRRRECGFDLKIIALDIGSSFTKAAILDTAEERMEHLLRVPTPARDAGRPQDCFECDPQAILSMVEQLIDTLFAHAPQAGAIYFSTQMHGGLLAKNGVPVTPYLSWQDTRALREDHGTVLVDLIAQRVGKQAIACMGTRYKAGLALCSLTGYLAEFPMECSGLQFHTLGSFLIYRLGDEKCHACHVTNAAATGFCDAGKGEWNQTIIETMGYSKLAFPKIVPETQPLGYYRGVPLYPAIGDHQASVFGIQAERENHAILTVGTAGIACAVTKEKAEAQEMELRPFFSGATLLTLTRQPGGRDVDVIIRLFQDTAALVGVELSAARAFEILLSRGQQDHGLRVLPGFFAGRGEGCIQNISKDNFQITELFYATLDGLAKAYAQAIQRMGQYTGGFSGILLSGGKLAKTEALRSRIEWMTGLKTVCSQREDEALWGLMEIAKKKEFHT